MSSVPSGGWETRHLGIGWSSISSRYVFPLLIFPAPHSPAHPRMSTRAPASLTPSPQFGRGPRTCSGKAITMMEMSKLVPELVLRYEIGLADARHDWTVCNDWFVRQYDFLCTVRARK